MTMPKEWPVSTRSLFVRTDTATWKKVEGMYPNCRNPERVRRMADRIIEGKKK